MTDTLEDIFVLLDSPKISEIIPNRLYLGNIDAVRDASLLKDTGITAVVSLCRSKHVSKEFIRNLLPPKCAHMYIDIEDHSDSDIAQYFAMTANFIKSHLHPKWGGKVFVHCMSGMSRSATIVASYLLTESPEKMVYDVLEELKEKRCIIRPNRGFLEQLLKVYGK